ncbi:hypothetical protein QYG89_14725 [Bacillus sp. B190/17]|uniref:Lipid II:glycine glycyltransferase n=1 Tax=Bacillus lumedeiriae TaxID=3058829 RepID=A0ABW8IBM2_9BACI
MITIARQLWGIKLQNVYFPEKSDSLVSDRSFDLIGITQSLTPSDKLNKLETLQIDLTKSEEELLADMTKSTRQQIRQAIQKYDFHFQVFPKPANNDLYAFQSFYNQFAEHKNTYKCRAFHIQTLKLLRDNGNMLMTQITNENNDVLCCRIYAIDGQRATSLYSVSHFRLNDDQTRKRILSNAHRYLKWKDMTWLKNNGYRVYDSGGLTSDNNIRKFKLEFGGTIVTEYSGYVANTLKGRMLLGIRRLNMSK